MTDPTYDYSGRVAFITGASSGMGAETARWFARSGAAVVLADVTAEPLRKLAEELTGAGAAAVAVRATSPMRSRWRTPCPWPTSSSGDWTSRSTRRGSRSPPSISRTRTLCTSIASTGQPAGTWAAMKHELKIMRRQGSAPS